MNEDEYVGKAEAWRLMSIESKEDLRNFVKIILI